MTEPYPFPTSADEFADKRVLVTGGTRGIGAAVVRRFQLAGARVVATARSASAHCDQGAANWAAVASLIETCKLNGVDPQAYIEDVLTKLVNLWPASRIDDLMPWAWARAQNSTERIAA